MFVQELDRPAYLVVEKRGFDDKELGASGNVLSTVLRLQDEANKLQLWLREVYLAGDYSHRVAVPSWLLNEAANDAMREQQGTDQASSKTLRLKPTKMALSTSTKVSSSGTKAPQDGTNQTSS